MACQQHWNSAKTPLCRFGPGGDYQKTWPPDSGRLTDYDAIGLFGRVGIVLAWLAGTIYRLWKGLYPAVAQISDRPCRLKHDDNVRVSVLPDSVTAASPSFRSVQLWRCTDAPFSARKRTRKISREDLSHSHTQTSTDTASDPFLPHQQWLFPDFAGDGRQSPVKQSNRFRARGNSRAKRASASFAQQGTLFDA